MCSCDFRNLTILSVVYLSILNFLLSVSCERIIFPDVFDSKYKFQVVPDDKQGESSNTKTNNNKEMEIPLEMIMELNSIQNATELLEKFVVSEKDAKALKEMKDLKVQTAGFGGGLFGGYGMTSKLHGSPYFLSENEGLRGEGIPIDEHLEILTRSAATSVERVAGVKIPKPAGCATSLEVISLYSTDDRKIFPFPSCTRVKRCSGCCQHELLMCQPVKTEIVNYQVIIMEYAGDNKLNVKGKEIVSIEEHTKCQCDCIIKESNCTALQEYKASECRCTCTNKDDEQKCLAEIENENKLNKLWDPHTCLCKCRNILECSSGHFFSEATCQCETITALTIRGGTTTTLQDPDPHEYNTYKLISIRDRQRYRQPV